MESYAYEVVFVRHGESEYNVSGRFTGWIDCDITEKGRDQAKQAAHILKEKGFTFDHAFTSVLKRSIRSLNIMLQELDLEWIPVTKSWRLNERFYGGMQGMSKEEASAIYGENRVMEVWRQSFTAPPPEIDESHPHWPGRDRRYHCIPEGVMPKSESLKDVQTRALVHWHEAIVPEIKSGKRVLVAAHGNSMRGVVKYLDNLSDDVIVSTRIPNASPFAFRFDKDMNVITRYTIGTDNS